MQSSELIGKKVVIGSPHMCRLITGEIKSANEKTCKVITERGQVYAFYIKSNDTFIGHGYSSNLSAKLLENIVE